MRPKLVLIAGKADKAEIRLKLPTIVGRTHDAGLMIAHKTVSRRHCELFERHGMLFVRDTGSRNGTLVDNAAIKEAMVKPGHTLTIGPLTFRAEYEPADAFMDSESPAPANGSATVAGAAKGVTQLLPTGAEDETAWNSADAGLTPTATTTTQPTKASDTPQVGGLEFEEIGSDDLGELDMPTAIDSKDDLAAAIESADQAIAAGGDDLSLDDDLGMSFDLDDTSNAPAAAAAEEIVEFEVSEKSSAPDNDLAIPSLESDDELMSFDLTEDSSTPAASGSVDALLDDDLGFEAAPLSKSASPADDLADELGFTLEDLEEPVLGPPALDDPPEDAEDVEMTFEIAEPDAPEPAPKPAPKPAVAKPVAKDTAATKVPLGEEKSSGGDAGMSAFLKDLGL